MELSPLDNSVIFKKLFREPTVLTEFFKDLTGIQLHLTADNIELEKRFSPPVGLIDIAFDIFAEDPERRIIVEIQRVHYHYLIHRFEHYHHAAIMEMQRNYQQYKPNRTVYTIVWLTMASEEPPYNQGLSVSRNYFESTNGTKSAESPHRMYLINPRYRNDPTIPAGVADWMSLVQESIQHPKNPTINLQRSIFQRATQLIAADTITSAERAAIMEERELEATIDKGIKSEQQRIVQTMLTQGLDFATIARFTGLREEDVTVLQTLNRSNS